MVIHLYATVKRINSTQQPTGSGVTKQIVLKDSTSLLNPTFILNYDNFNPTQYNYCYAPDFLRYYYIKDWVFTGRLWECQCEVDPLASFKSQILGGSYYVLRSQSNSDPRIIDTQYVAKSGLHYLESAVNINLPSNMIGGGTFCVGISGYPTTGGVQAGCGVKYFLCDSLQISNVVQKIFTGLPSDWDDLNGKNLLEVGIKAIISPIQYITSCTWLPFSSNSSNYETVYFGYWNTGVSAPLMDNHIVTYYQNVSVPKPPHSRGDWQMLAPFAEYTLYIPYYGMFPLPPEKLLNCDAITVYIQTDWITGKSTLKVFRADNGHFILMSNAQIGVPVQISGRNFDFGGVFSGISQSIGGFNQMRAGTANTILSTFTGNVSGVASGAMSVSGGKATVASGFIESAISAARPITQSMGNNGGNSSDGSRIVIYCAYYDPTDEDNTHFGRPLCQVKQLSALSGYCQVMDGYDARIRGTPTEKTMIKNFLEGGFYIE